MYLFSNRFERANIQKNEDFGKEVRGFSNIIRRNELESEAGANISLSVVQIGVAEAGFAIT